MIADGVEKKNKPFLILLTGMDLLVMSSELLAQWNDFGEKNLRASVNHSGMLLR